MENEEEQETKLSFVKYFLKSKRVSSSYISKKTGIPYQTLMYYNQDYSRLDRASKIIVERLYSFIVDDIGAQTTIDIGCIRRKEEYFVDR